MRALLLLPTLLLATASAPAAYEHYDPAILEARAAEHMRAGDFDSARVLLARAARIAPGDPRIAQRLRELETHAAPAPIESRPTAPPTPAPKARAPEVLPEPPALWPIR